jgi:hypothetical protein
VFVSDIHGIDAVGSGGGTATQQFRMDTVETQRDFGDATP